MSIGFKSFLLNEKCSKQSKVYSKAQIPDILLDYSILLRLYVGLYIQYIVLIDDVAYQVHLRHLLIMENEII